MKIILPISGFVPVHGLRPFLHPVKSKWRPPLHFAIVDDTFCPTVNECFDFHQNGLLDR